jgi:hypothetical protein
MSLSDVAAFKAAVGISADDYGAGAQTGTGVDTLGFHQALVVLNVGTVTTSLDVKLQESSDNGGSDTFADITGAAFTQVTTANDVAVYVGRVNLTGTERYIRVVGTGVGGSQSYGVSIILTPYYTGDGSTFEFEV